MTAMINGNHTEVLAQFFKAHEPIEICCCGPTVQQDNSGRAWWSDHFAIERGPSTRQDKVMPDGQDGNGIVVQLSTFMIVTETVAPFSNVTLTLSPAR